MSDYNFDKKCNYDRNTVIYTLLSLAVMAVVGWEMLS